MDTVYPNAQLSDDSNNDAANAPNTDLDANLNHVDEALLYPNRQALLAYPSQLKSKLHPEPHAWGLVERDMALTLQPNDSIKFFKPHNHNWVEVRPPLSPADSSWICVQRMNLPVNQVGSASTNSSQSSALGSAAMAQNNAGTPQVVDEQNIDPVVINEAATPEATYTLTLAYLDENGEPMENTDFKVELDTGQIIEGSLDDSGQYAIADLPAAVASIQYRPRASEMARLRGELSDALNGVLSEAKQRAAIEQAIFDEENLATQGLILTGAFMVKMWDGAVNVVDGVIEAGSDIVDIASDLAKLQLEFYKRLLAGEALTMLKELYVTIAELAGTAKAMAEKAWHVLEMLALDGQTWQMLLSFPKDYFTSLSTVGKVELFGAVGFEIIFAIACAAATALTAGAGAAVVGSLAAVRYSRFFTPLINAVRQLWRLQDKTRVVAPKPQQRLDRDLTVKSQEGKPDTTLPSTSESRVQSTQTANGNTCSPTGQCTRAGEPINMMTGEELYDTVDFSVPGVVPINFVRQYRTTLVGQRTSLGFGWSHTFSEYFKREGDVLAFVDQEFLTTDFGQVSRRTFVRNQLGMTLYWGDEGADEEITLKHNGVVKRFRQLDQPGVYQLTHIESIDRQQGWQLHYQQVSGQIQPVLATATWGDTLSLNYGKYGLASIDWNAASGHTQRLARYLIDASGDLIAARNQAGRLEQYRYQQHTITLRKLATGAIYDFEWSELGPDARATRQQERGGSYHYQFEWQLEDNISRSIDSNGIVIEYEFDDQAHLIRQTMPDGNEERWHYSSLGDLLWYQDGNGHRTQYTYDDQQRLTKQINALGQQTRISYLGDTFLPARIMNAGGHTTRYAYNSLEQLTAIHHPDGRQARWVYQGGQLAKQVDADGQVHHYQWHPQWGSIARYLQTTAKGEVLSELAFGYDEQGRLVSQTVVGQGDQSGGLGDKTSHFVYDEQGQLTSQIDPFGKSQKLEYDSFGRVVAHIDHAGRATQFEYGKFAQVERLIQPDGNQVSYEYDKERNLTALINQNGQAHRFEYDVHERIRREITVDGRTTDYAYDGAGRVVALKEGDLTATFERNELGMLMREQHSSPNKQSVTIDYQYDELNRLVLADNGHAQTKLSYDLAGRLTQELNRQSFNPFGQRVQPHQHTTGIHYRDDGLVSHLHHESFKPKPQGLKYGFMHSDGRKDEWYQEYHWNSQQQLVGMLLNDEQLFSQQFNAQGQLSRRQQGAHQLEFSYDPESRLAQTKRLGSAHELIKQRDYGYDEFGRLEQVSEQGSASAKPFVKQYQYDAVDRLTSVVQGEDVQHAVRQNIQQDKAGNLLPEGLTELTNNQLPFWGDRHFEYDSHGNLKTETSGANGCKKKQFFYNAKHQLVALLQSVDRKATLYSEYLYDALGRRIEKIVWQLDASLTGVETEQQLADLARQQGEVVNHERYAWQGSTLVHVRKLINGGNQQLTAERYIYEPGTHVPLAMHDTELGTLHFDVDHLGTPKGLFDSAGEKLWQAEHSVYGQVESERSFKLHLVTGQQVAPKLRFQGQYEDAESGLFYNLNRYYDAEIGRYTTQDPIGLLGGLNSYQYCPNPVGWVDPLGLACKENSWNVFQRNTKGHFTSSTEAAEAYRKLKVVQGMHDTKHLRPDPSEYLPESYINAHLDQFSNGASRFMTRTNLLKYGPGQRDGTSFVMPSSEADSLMTLAKTDLQKLADSLGLPIETIQGGDLVRVDFDNPRQFGLRVPTGREAGANEYWLAGGKLPDGTSEAVIDVGNLTEDMYSWKAVK